jgi:two-component system cell cycle response regulator
MSIKILAVDDSKTIRLIVAKAFKPFDCRILEAENGVAGLAVAKREKPDLILLDYTMPVMDGLEVLARLRSDPDLKATPVIMLTAEAGRDTVTKIARLGVRDYLIKPFQGELLVERVGRVVDLRTKSDAVIGNKRFDDPISLLVVDDKPAIAEQIRAGLAGTPWKVTSASQPAHALELCQAQGIDFVLASFSLPDEGAQRLVQDLRACAGTASIPIFGLCVKTAAADHADFANAGFGGLLTKPIDCADLKARVSKTLKLETSYKYFQQHDGVLVLSLPDKFNPEVRDTVLPELNSRLSAIVDAGGDKLILDLSAIEEATLPVMELVLSATQAAADLSIRHAMVGSENLRAQCRKNYEESQAWQFAATVEAAAALLK